MDKKGFTLIELLVVIGIIALLASLLLPALAKAKAQAYSTTCKNRLYQMGLALQMYVHENGNKYPYIVCLPDPAHNNPATANWFNKLEPYYSIKWTDDIYHCPGYKGAIDVETNIPSTATHDPYGSYAYNWRGVRGYAKGSPSETNLGLGAALYDTVRDRRRQITAISETQIRVPSEMFSIGESRFRQDKIFNAADCVDGLFCGYLRGRWMAISFPKRHGQKYNQLFCDGHVTAIDPWILFNPTNSARMWNNDHQPHPESWPRF